MLIIYRKADRVVATHTGYNPSAPNGPEDAAPYIEALVLNIAYWGGVAEDYGEYRLNDIDNEADVLALLYSAGADVNLDGDLLPMGLTLFPFLDMKTVYYYYGASWSVPPPTAGLVNSGQVSAYGDDPNVKLDVNGMVEIYAVLPPGSPDSQVTIDIEPNPHNTGAVNNPVVAGPQNIGVNHIDGGDVDGVITDTWSIMRVKFYYAGQYTVKVSSARHGSKSVSIYVLPNAMSGDDTGPLYAKPWIGTTYGDVWNQAPDGYDPQSFETYVITFMRDVLGAKETLAQRVETLEVVDGLQTTNHNTLKSTHNSMQADLRVLWFDFYHSDAPAYWECP